MAWLLGGLLAAVLFLAPLIGLFSQPFAPWWFGQHAAQTIDVEGGPAPHVDVPQTAHGVVSDRQRYLLARAAGWTFQESITSVAISIAEDGSGDPAALSPRNTNGTFDLGLFQINSIHWQICGGQAALLDPFTNARCAYGIYRAGGWCPWSTFERSCGPGHTAAYVAFLGRARAAAEG